MVYPDSPFTDNFNISSIISLHKSNASVDVNETYNLIGIQQWLCQAPKISTFRVNTLVNNTQTVKKYLKASLIEIEKRQGKSQCTPQVLVHPVLSDVIIIEFYHKDKLDLKKRNQEIIVDPFCGVAILRGAHIFAPGVMAMQTGSKIGDKVSVYADVTKSCKKGLQKIYNCPQKIFIANGIVKMVRSEIFGENLNRTGIAIEITDNISGCPNLSDSNLPLGSALLQNIPSIVCGRVLNPQPGETILDMCAAPGNKTSHLAALMQNQGLLIAVDKTPNKIKQLKKKCIDFSVQCVEAYEFDSTRLYDESLNETPVDCGPPFCRESFDRILLDAPCSGLGNRPQLLNTITNKVMQSYVPLQRKLFKNAVNLLKKDGYLVYSTCTITLAENEGIVNWALENFQCLELIQATPILGGHGWSGTNLTQDQLQLVQRFGPEQGFDSIGFFIAHFKKKY